MNITLVTVGSRGDVHPYIALGGGLKSAGHSVRIATHAYFERLIRKRGLEFAPIAGDPREAVESDAGQAWLATGSNPVAFFRRMIDVMRPLMAAAVDDGLGACRDADLVLYSMLGWFGAHHVIEKLGDNGMAPYQQPGTPTREFPPLFSASRLTLGGFHYGLQYAVGEQLVWALFRRSVNDVRRTMQRWMVVMMLVLLAAGIISALAAMRPILSELNRGWAMLVGRRAPEKSIGNLERRVRALEQQLGMG